MKIKWTSWQWSGISLWIDNPTSVGFLLDIWLSNPFSLKFIIYCRISNIHCRFKHWHCGKSEECQGCLISYFANELSWIVFWLSKFFNFFFKFVCRGDFQPYYCVRVLLWNHWNGRFWRVPGMHVFTRVITCVSILNCFPGKLLVGLRQRVLHRRLVFWKTCAGGGMNPVILFSLNVLNCNFNFEIVPLFSKLFFSSFMCKIADVHCSFEISRFGDSSKKRGRHLSFISISTLKLFWICDSWIGELSLAPFILSGFCRKVPSFGDSKTDKMETLWGTRDALFKLFLPTCLDSYFENGKNFNWVCFGTPGWIAPIQWSFKFRKNGHSGKYQEFSVFILCRSFPGLFWVEYGNKPEWHSLCFPRKVSEFLSCFRKCFNGISSQIC